MEKINSKTVHFVNNTLRIEVVSNLIGDQLSKESIQKVHLDDLEDFYNIGINLIKEIKILFTQTNFITTVN